MVDIMEDNLIGLSLTLYIKVKMNDNQYNGLFTNHKDKMVGYWPSSFLCVYELTQSWSKIC